MGRKRTSTFENYWGVRLSYEDQLKLERILAKLRIGGETKSEKLRLLIREIYRQQFS